MLIALWLISPDSSNQAWFEERLISMPINESIYLLTTFANMARSRPHTETNFMEAVAVEIFNVGPSYGLK